MLWGTAGSALVGVLLFLFLPRGVVLTKSVPDAQADWTRQHVRVVNSSANHIRIVSVKVMSIELTQDTTDPDPVDLYVEGCLGVHLGFDDPKLETTRSHTPMPWSKVVIPPGEGLTATMSNYTAMTIRYRRAGAIGVLERRQLTVQGDK